jgi:hypothetical protein
MRRVPEKLYTVFDRRATACSAIDDARLAGRSVRAALDL